jgi:uncharacterized protein
MSKSDNLYSNSRIQIVDALRGSALLGILLLHSVEHWESQRYPEHSSALLSLLDVKTYNLTTFLFTNKAYSIFAMMFGLSFFLIMESWSKRDTKFQGRFLWRLCILGIFGYLEGIIYCGDVLLVLAILGIPLVLLYKLSNRTLIWIAIVLLLQLPMLWQVVHIFHDQAYQPGIPDQWKYFGHLNEVYSKGTFWEVTKTNLWKGQLSRLLWTVETGRYLQMEGLFICGLLIGRSRVFQDPTRYLKLGKRLLIIGTISFVILYPIKKHLGYWDLKDMRYFYTDSLFFTYCSMAQMAIWTGGFILLYQWTKTNGVLNLLAPYGRMSLTLYVTQALVGVPLFYGYGLALYHYMGPFYSIFYGATFFIVQSIFAYYWLKNFNYGPLEWLWRSFTFFSFKTPLRKRKLISIEN